MGLLSAAKNQGSFPRFRGTHSRPVAFMVAPLRVELNPPAFQTGARTRYAREPFKTWSGVPDLNRC